MDGLWSFFACRAALVAVGQSHYADRYDTDDLVYRLWAAAQMVAVLVMAASLAHGPSESTIVFAAGYASARLVLLALYWRVYRRLRDSSPGHWLSDRFRAAAVVWLASVFVPDPARFAVWGVALAIDLATPWVVRRQQATVPLDESHPPGALRVVRDPGARRVACRGRGRGSAIRWTTSSLITVLGVLLATLLWWLYFDNAEGSVVRRRNIEGKTWRPTGWIYRIFRLRPRWRSWAWPSIRRFSVPAKGQCLPPSVGSWSEAWLLHWYASRSSKSPRSATRRTSEQGHRDQPPGRSRFSR